MAQSPFVLSKQKFNEQACFFELSGSLILPKVGFVGTEFDCNSSKNDFRNGFGVAVRWQFDKQWSLAANVSYRETGVFFPNNNNYRLMSKNINVFVPFDFDIYIKAKPRVKPPQFVLFVGPYFSYGFNGEVVSDLIQQNLSAKNTSPFDVGIEAGAGMRIPTFSFTHRSFIIIKASYFYGFTNTFPKERVFDDFLMLSKTGKRYNNGIRITLAYELSMLKKEMSSFTAGGDGKKTYKRILVK